MGTQIVVLTAVVSGLAAAGLSPWLRALADSSSGWLRPVVPASLAVAAGAGAAAVATGAAELVGFALLALGCALLAAVDLASERLPDLIVGPLYPLLLVPLTVAAALHQEWSRLGRAAVAAAVLLVCYFVLAFISPSNLGLGDVKLAGVLGAFLGWLGWSPVLLGSLAAFALSAVTALVLLVAVRADRRRSYPFGPLMVAGAAVGAAWGPFFL